MTTTLTPDPEVNVIIRILAARGRDVLGDEVLADERIPMPILAEHPDTIDTFARFITHNGGE